MNSVVQDLMTHYERRGSGQVIVLIHGWADTLETFHELATQLSAKNDVVRVDLPGFGATEAPKQVWNLDNYAQFLAAFLDKLAITDYVLIGHSNGGAVAIRGIGQGLLKPKKLILLAASGVRSGGSMRRMILKIIAKTGKILTFWLPRSTRRKLQIKLYGAAGSDMLVAPQLKETFKRTVRQDIQTDAKQIAVPTLLLYGEEDKATPVTSVGQVLHDCIRGSELTVIPGADHFVYQPASNVRSAIEEFLL